MSSFARVALGPVQSLLDITPMSWALASLLRDRGSQVQVFHEQACLAQEQSCRAVCGQSPRYLDSWLMTPELCRESFAFAMSGVDLGIVVGKQPRAASRQADVVSVADVGNVTQPSSLETLCDWLDLPRIAVLDMAETDFCRIPPKPEGASAILLDRVPRGKYFDWQVACEALWGIPVVGGLPELAELRGKLKSCDISQDLLCGLCQRLGESLAATFQPSRLWDIARRPFVPPAPKIFRKTDKLRGLRVAIAYDEAFDQYFPAVLDLLEMQGAQVKDFSPLRDQTLPEETDVVYLGGGRPEKFLAELAGNQCLAMSLREHVRQDRRVYAEGAGTVLLSQQASHPDFGLVPMWGIIPGMASFSASHGKPPGASPQGAEVMLSHDHWLGQAGSVLRGYRNSQWRLESANSLPVLDRGSADPCLFTWRQVVASMIQINFAAQPDFLRCFSSSGAVVS